MKAIVYLTALLLAACGGGGSTIPTQPEPTGGYLVSAYGDSTQEAQGQPHAASRPGAMVYNRGVSGTNEQQLLAGTDGRNYAWAEMVKRESARIVVINHGINSRGYPLSEYRQNLKTLVEVAQAAGLVVMLEEPNPAGETRTPLMDALKFDVEAFEKRRAAMREVASHTGVYFCAQPRVPLADGIHPTPEGYAIKANRLAACIADMLK
ncbi:SGNH/GDSL hydrolase family protein [Hydrogenophaga crocea]|uniref:SGNH hydrolase-type esterase domain-containing protein n=1 Tax=Hydrogenophaga crocea TaxID=2716225 RepID=A0A6G8IEK3_9BURK|nr:SGNH/GDSL hydrolase family protein [Hydrogenophaga crocea]QIM51634.1 hypothetical protein G9Q37_05510 [Hydrogenophaga crocea]